MGNVEDTGRAIDQPNCCRFGTYPSTRLSGRPRPQRYCSALQLLDYKSYRYFIRPIIYATNAPLKTAFSLRTPKEAEALFHLVLKESLEADLQ